MAFLRSSARSQAVECFFCLSTSVLPPSHYRDRKGKARANEVGTRWNWLCERCGCWNVRDVQGRMLDDLPAMHNPELNKASFSMRGRPSSSHLPPTSSSSIFCHSCLANQMLITNMLANYLPEDSDPAFPHLYASLPTYTRSLHERYPPVCASCQPAVDEALRKSDMRAQSEALSLALKNGIPAAPSSTARQKKTERHWEVAVWRLRGVLWFMSLGLRIRQAVDNWLDPSISWVKITTLDRKMMVALNFASVLWVAWNPYWLRTARSRGRIKLMGHDTWIRNMLLIYCIRLLATSLSAVKDNLTFVDRLNAILAAVEVFMLAQAFMSLRPSAPIALQLVRPVSIDVTRSTSPVRPVSALPRSPHAGDEMPATSSPRSNPVFGQPSFQAPPHSDQSEPMDWEPLPVNGRGELVADDTDEDNLSLRKADWDKFGVGKQRMFDRATQETGLEGLLATWGIGSTGTTDVSPQVAFDLKQPPTGRSWTSQVAVFLRVCLALLGIGRLLYVRRKHLASGSAYVPWTTQVEYAIGGVESALSFVRRLDVEILGLDKRKGFRALGLCISGARCGLLLAQGRWLSPQSANSIFGLLDICDACI